MFIPENVILFDLEKKFSILGVAERNKDGLFCMPDYQSPQSTNHLIMKEGKVMSPMIAVVKKSARISSTADNLKSNGSSTVDKQPSTA